MNRIKQGLTGCVVLFFLCCLFLRPTRYLAAFSSGVSLWAVSVLPSSFPFLFGVGLLSDTGLTQKIERRLSPFFRFLFGVSGVGGGIFVLSFLSGYPVGAKLLSESGLPPLEQEKLSPLTSHVSPLFAVGCIGSLLSVKAGWIVLISNFLAVLLTGIIFRGRKIEGKEGTLIVHKTELKERMISSLLSVLSVGGYVALFSALSLMIEDVLPLTLPYLSGLVEMTIGCQRVASLPLAIPLSAFYVTFGGACILLQQLTFLSVKPLPFLLTKLFEGILAFLIALVGAYYL